MKKTGAMKASILTTIAIVGFAGSFTLLDWKLNPATLKAVATPSIPAQAPSATTPEPVILPALKYEAPVATYFTVQAPDGKPCHVKLVQTSGASANVMNLVTDCPQKTGKVDWLNPRLPEKLP